MKSDVRSTMGMAGMLGLAAACFVLVASGCGAGDGRERVTGTVTLDGERAAEGAVTLEPDAGAKASSVGAPIVKGMFEIPAQSGPLPGKYRAKVITSKPTGKMSEGPGGMQIPEMAPVKIAESAGIDVTVTKGGPNKPDVKVTTAR